MADIEVLASTMHNHGDLWTWFADRGHGLKIFELASDVFIYYTILFCPPPLIVLDPPLCLCGFAHKNFSKNVKFEYAADEYY